MAPTAKPTIYLIGDASLVEEFGKCCHDSGVVVFGKINEARAKPAPKFIKTSTKIPRNVECCFELTNSDLDRKEKNIQFLEQHSSPGSIICSSSVIITALQQSAWLRKPEKLIGMSALPTLLSHQLIELAPTRYTEGSVVRRLNNFFLTTGKQTAVVQDRVGMVMPRILCMLINEAAFALTENVASPKDIDLAMKLGTNYPFGPVEWGDKIGFSNVLDVLRALYNDMHEERYRVAPLLQQLSTGAKWWAT